MAPALSTFHRPTGLATQAILTWHSVNMVNDPFILYIVNGCNVCIDKKRIFSNKLDLIMSASLLS